jgi:hypothetical protein
MSGIFWRNLFMKRLFFVLLFALSALFFSACSSSDSGGDGGTPQQSTVQGAVIMPDGYIARVFVDANGSGTFDEGENSVNVEADGTFAIQAGSGYLLAAELTKNSVQTAVSAVNAPVIYTAPAGVSTLSSLTTLVKNKMDLNPGMSVTAAVTNVKTDTGLTADIFNAASYNAAIVTLNTNIAYVTQKTVDYILGELRETEVNSSIIAFLYGSISNVLLAISSADTDELDDISDDIEDNIGNGSEIADAIEKTETILNSEAWDLTNPIQLYLPDSDHTISNVSFTGSGMLLGEEEDISDLKGQPLPAPGNRDSLTFSRNEKGELGWSDDPDVEPEDKRIGGASFASSFRTDLSGKSLTADGGTRVRFSNGAYSYTVMEYDNIVPVPSGVDPMNYFGDNVSNFVKVWKYSSQWVDRLIQHADFSDSEISRGTRIGIGGRAYERGAITIVSNTAFRWAQEGECIDYLFSSCYVAPKNGTYTKISGNSYPDQSAKYRFKANDGTEWYLFYATSAMVDGINEYEGYNRLYEGWYIYQLLRDPIERKFFNDIAARDIIDRW